MRVCSVAQLCQTLCDPQAPLPGSSVHGILRQEYWSGLPCPPPGNLPNPGIESMPLTSPKLQADSLSTEPPGKPTWLEKISQIRENSITHILKVKKGGNI